jgi:hypothetical protein
VRVMRDKPLVNGVQHRVCFNQHLAIGKAQHMEALRRKQRRSSCMGQFSPFVEVLSTIQLDNQIRFDTREVGEESADGVLSAELVADETSVAQA